MSRFALHGTWFAACLVLLAGCAAETTETQRPVIDDETPPTDIQQRHTGVDEPQTGLGDEGAINTTDPATEPQPEDPTTADPASPPETEAQPEGNPPTPGETEAVDEVE